MSTGYDEDGVEDLECVRFPSKTRISRISDCGTEIPTQAFFLDEYSPNCWFWATGGLLSAVLANCSGVTYNNFVPGGTGQTDLCFEIWVKMRLGPSFVWSAVAPAVGSGAPRLGIGTTLATGVATGTGFGITHYGGTFRARFVENLTAIERTGTLPSGWHHVAVNLQRGGNLELFIDAISQGTTGGVTNYTFTNCNVNEGVRLDADHGGWTGPFALHAALLSSAAIRDSVIRKTVQVNANTEYAYDARDLVVTPPAGEDDKLVWRWVNTGIATMPSYVNFWRDNPNIDVGRDEMDNIYVLWPECDPLCPVGHIPDQSTNSRTAFIDRANNFSTTMCFSHDPFWR